MFKGYRIFLSIYIFTLLVSFSCSSSKKTNEENIAVQDSLKLLLSLPPGTADIKAEIIRCSEGKPDLICQLKILEVFSYGASVDPLPPGTEIEVYLTKDLTEQESNKVLEKEIVFARISQTITPETKYWSIIMFNK